MKTTVEIADALLEGARRQAAREHTTVRALIEEGLRTVLDRGGRRRPFKLRQVTFRGKGLHPDLAGKGWDAIRERAYEEHGE